MLRRAELLMVVLLVGLIVTGCARRDRVDPADGALDRRLGASPSTLVPGEAGTAGSDGSPASPATDESGAPMSTSTSARSGGGGGPVGPGGAPTSRCGGYKPAASIADGKGDAGLGAPSYADVTSVVIEDDGDRLRLTVSMNGPLPPALGERETLGVGLDLFAPGDREGSYQLFVQGDTDGWLAYLHTPDGLVEYPGTFALGGNQMVLTARWSDLSRSLNAVSLFADWSKPALAVNTGGSDRAPTNGTSPLRPC